jgi:hypothetical protein
MTDTDNTSEPRTLPPPQRRLRLSRSTMGAGALIVVLAAGAALGAGGTRMAQRWQPQSVMLLQPAPIDKMTDASAVAIKGEVAEIFGNKFVMQDPTGRALVDTGPRGEDRAVVAKGEAVTVQGRFDHGVIHAQVVAHADGRNEAFGPPHGPKGPKGPDGPRGPKGGPKEDGPGARADRGPPPPDDETPQPPR